MEITTSTLLNATRVGLQVITKTNKPVLEIYMELRNIIAPPQKINGIEYRDQKTFIQLSLVNLGGIRAENISINYEGDREFIHYFKKLFPNILNNYEIRQFPPAQVMQIMRIDTSELIEYQESKNLKGQNIKKPKAIKNKGFILTIKYNAPYSGLNYLIRPFYDLFCIKQYTQTFYFDPLLFENIQLPNPQYNG